MNEVSTIAEVKGAVKRFTAPEGGVIKALDGLSLEIQHKQFVTLLGPSGCGKTTLLKAISGFEDLDAGEVRIAGEAHDGRAAASPPGQHGLSRTTRSFRT